MAFDSYRDFVHQLQKAGELKRISQPVATELEITELSDRQMKSPGGGKALLIENPTVNGESSPFPVAINTMGSWKRMAMSLGANSVDEAATELGSLMKAKPPATFKEAIKLLGTALDLRHAKPKLVRTGPCKEVVRQFESPVPRVEPWPQAPEIIQSANTPTLQHSNSPTLLDLPIQKCWPLDGGRFITMPCVVTKDPDSGER